MPLARHVKSWLLLNDYISKPVIGARLGEPWVVLAIGKATKAKGAVSLGLDSCKLHGSTGSKLKRSKLPKSQVLGYKLIHI